VTMNFIEVEVGFTSNLVTSSMTPPALSKIICDATSVDQFVIDKKDYVKFISMQLCKLIKLKFDVGTVQSYMNYEMNNLQEKLCVH